MHAGRHRHSKSSAVPDSYHPKRVCQDIELIRSWYPNSLLAYILERIKKRTNQTISISDFRRWLGAFPWLLILDGLDEVPASSNRQEVLNSILEFWVDAAETGADVLVLATTRPQGYTDDFSPSQYSHNWLVPLSVERATHYANRLVHNR